MPKFKNSGYYFGEEGIFMAFCFAVKGQISWILWLIYD